MRAPRVAVVLALAAAVHVAGPAQAADPPPTSIDVADPTFGVNGATSITSFGAGSDTAPVIDADGRIRGINHNAVYDIGTIAYTFEVTTVSAWDGAWGTASALIDCPKAACIPEYLGHDAQGDLVINVEVSDSRSGRPRERRIFVLRKETGWATTYGGSGSVAGRALLVNPDGTVISTNAGAARKLTRSGSTAAGFAIADPVPDGTRLLPMPGGAYLGCQGEINPAVGCSMYSPTGSLVTTWGAAGRIANGVRATRRSDGSVLVLRGVGAVACQDGRCAYAVHEAVLVGADGRVSTTFGSAGKAALEPGAPVFVGATSSQLAWVVLDSGQVHLLSAAGRPVPALGSDGSFAIPRYNTPTSAALAPDGSIYIGASAGGDEGLLVRLRPSGLVEQAAGPARQVLAHAGKIYVWDGGATVERYDPAAPIPLGFRSLSTPVRLIDTRRKLDGPALEPHQRRRFILPDAAGLSRNPAATALNLTVTGSSAPGYVMAWPCDDVWTSPRPSASVINFGAGETIANSLVIDAHDETRGLCLLASSAVHLIADATGSFLTDFDAVAPARILDTRPDLMGSIEAAGGSIGSDRAAPLQPQQTSRFIVTRTSGLPGDPAGIAFNLTAVDASGAGYLRVWPCSSAEAPPPATSAMNFGTRPVAASIIVDADGPTGGICVRPSHRLHLVIDTTGYAPARYTSLMTPIRLLDSRPGSTGSLERIGGSLGSDRATPLAPASVSRFVVTGASGLPRDPAGLNLTVVLVPAEHATSGFVKVYPCASTSSPAPATSVINLAGDRPVSNTVLLDPDASGGICLRSSATAHVILDVAGYFPAA